MKRSIVYTRSGRRTMRNIRMSRYGDPEIVLDPTARAIVTLDCNALLERDQTIAAVRVGFERVSVKAENGDRAVRLTIEGGALASPDYGRGGFDAEASAGLVHVLISTFDGENVVETIRVRPSSRPTLKVPSYAVVAPIEHQVLHDISQGDIPLDQPIEVDEIHRYFFNAVPMGLYDDGSNPNSFPLWNKLGVI